MAKQQARTRMLVNLPSDLYREMMRAAWDGKTRITHIIDDTLTGKRRPFPQHDSERRMSIIRLAPAMDTAIRQIAHDENLAAGKRAVSLASIVEDILTGQRPPLVLDKE